jgi:hypothetical protein
MAVLNGVVMVRILMIGSPKSLVTRRSIC